jgi:hypothetical protein
MKINVSFPNLKITKKNVNSNSLSCTLKEKSDNKEHAEPNKPWYHYLGMRKKSHSSDIINKEASKKTIRSSLRLREKQIKNKTAYSICISKTEKSGKQLERKRITKQNSASCIKEKSDDKEHAEPNKPWYHHLGMRKKNHSSDIINKEASKIGKQSERKHYVKPNSASCIKEKSDDKEHSVPKNPWIHKIGIGMANSSNTITKKLSNFSSKKTIRSSLRLKKNQNNKTQNNKNSVTNEFFMTENFFINSLLKNEQAPFFVTSANFEDKTLISKDSSYRLKLGDTKLIDNNKSIRSNLNVSNQLNERPTFYVTPANYEETNLITNDSSNANFRLKLEDSKMIINNESIRSNLSVSTKGLWEKFRYKINNKKCYPVMCMICYHIDYNGNIRRHLKTHKIECKCKKRANFCNCKFEQHLSISNDKVNEDKISKEGLVKQNLESTRKQEGNQLRKGLWMKSNDKKYYQVKCLICGTIKNNGNIKMHLKKHKKECICKRADSCTCNIVQQIPPDFQTSDVIIDTLELLENEKIESQKNSNKKKNNKKNNEENNVDSEIFIMNPIETHSVKKHHCKECNKWFNHNKGLIEHKKRACHLNVLANLKIKFIVGEEAITNKAYNDLISEKGWLSDAVGFLI